MHRASLLALLFVAGCLGPAADPAPSGSPLAIQFDCANATLTPANGACVGFLDPTPTRDTEANLAAHPTDAATVLATWKVSQPGGADIWAAITHDTGRTWTTTRLSDPALEGQTPPGAVHHEFDSIAAFGPDGTAYVLYGGGDTRSRVDLPAGGGVVYAEFMDRITLASSSDGVTWAYYPFAEYPAGVIAQDFMDLAVAPDTGDLYVVAQIFFFGPVGASSPFVPIPFLGAYEGVWLWHSVDGGATWSAPVPVYPPVGVGGTSPFTPRVAAGPDGLVTVSASQFFYRDGSEARYVAISRDGAASFDGAVRLPVDEYVAYTGDPMVIWSPIGGEARIDLAYGSLSEILLVRSVDGGQTWNDPIRMAGVPDGTTNAWTMAAVDRSGATYVMHRWGSTDPDRFGVGIVRFGLDGVVTETMLVDAPGFPGAYQLGDDYGGLAVAADGSVWAAWADPRGADLSRIAVSHLVPAAQVTG